MKKLDFKVLLPNVITLTGLSFGLSSIRFAIELDFNLAIICILFAGVCDVLDGMLARHLQSESDLGAQLDSLSDFLSFGIAPGLLIYMSIFNQDFHYIFLLKAGFIQCEAGKVENRRWGTRSLF